MTDLTKLYKSEEQWCKGIGDGSCSCIVQRMLQLNYPGTLHTKIQRAAQALFPNRGGTKGHSEYYSFVAFNDHPDTTFADVQAVLKRAQELLEAAT